MKTVIIIIITVVATVLVVGAVGIALKSKGKFSDKDPTVVRIEKPQRSGLVEFINAPGVVEPKLKVEISAKVSARIAELPYDEGERVYKADPNSDPPGQASVLLRLDASDLKAALRAAEANRAASAAQIEVGKMELESRRASIQGRRVLLEQARRELNRRKKLKASQDASQSELDEAQCHLDELQTQIAASEHSLKAAELSLVVSQHRLEAADADIARARENLSHTTITSPIDGIVTRCNAEVGEMVITGTMNNPGTVIMEVADLSQMLLIAQVDEADVARVKVGQNAKVHIQAWPDTVFEGVVDSVALTQNMARDGSRYFKTEILLKNSDQQIFSGLSADVDIEIRKHKDVLKVPSQAILGREVDTLPVEIRENCPEVDKKKIYASVVYRYIDGEAIVTPVKIDKSDATHTIILSGITEDDQIIAGPYKVLEAIKHEQKVKDEREVEKEKAKEEEVQSPNSLLKKS